MQQSKVLRFGDVEDPMVIDDELIRKEIQRYKEENKIMTKGEIPLHEITILSLSYKNILKLQNLQGLDKLEKLQLDNNTIAKIENLDHLVNLKWLDLSFNCITEISGLEKLVKLEDLSLYSNLIEKIDGLKTLMNLNVLSIGNNKLTAVKQMVQHLQWLENLEVLNMAGNDWDEKDYGKSVIPALKNLKYIDYVYITEKDRNDYGTGGEAISLGNGEDDAKDKEKKKEEEEERNFELLKISRLYKYDEKLIEGGNPLLKELLEYEDIFDSSYNQFKEETKKKIDEFRVQLTEKIKEKEEDMESFKQMIKILEKEKEKDIAALLVVYQRHKRHCDLDCEERVPEWRDNCENILVELEDFDRKLMKRELDLLSSLQDIQKKHESYIDDVYKSFSGLGTDIGKTISKTIDDFFERFKSDAKAEESKRNNVEDEDEEVNLDTTENPDFDGEYRDPIEDDDDPFKNLMSELNPQVTDFKESLDTRHKQVIADLNSQFNTEKRDYLDQIRKLLNERNRESVKNIMSFIKAENEHWRMQIDSN